MQVYPSTAPQDQRTRTLVRHLRSDVIPPVAHATGLGVFIGGSTATEIDFTRVISGKLPLFIGVVVALSVLLLMAVFRSVLVPLKAAAMNLLSIVAALGVVTLIFHDGFLAGPLGIGKTGPIESFLPVMLFAIVFGLSMDYEVFLMSRVHEEWENSGDPRLAVTRGLAETARVITAAAVIMILVFASFVLLPDRVVKLFGIGLASAVFIDAFVIRSLLVPGIMHLLGARAWWLPSWIDRRLPHVGIEQHPPVTARPLPAEG
jgi:RND superfamily putative drug exporter